MGVFLACELETFGRVSFPGSVYTRRPDAKGTACCGRCRSAGTKVKRVGKERLVGLAPSEANRVWQWRVLNGTRWCSWNWVTAQVKLGWKVEHESQRLNVLGTGARPIGVELTAEEDDPRRRLWGIEIDSRFQVLLCCGHPFRALLGSCFGREVERWIFQIGGPWSVVSKLWVIRF